MQDRLPDFPFPLPRGYLWLAERQLVGFEPGTQLQPWYYLDRDNVFTAAEKWPDATHLEDHFAFAKRQDNDDVACFEIADGKVGIAIIHGWTPEGFDILERYTDFWQWFKSVVDDVAESCDGVEDPPAC